MKPSLMLPDAQIPEKLDGEPFHAPPPAPIFAIQLVVRTIMIDVLAILTLPLWPLFLLSVLIWGWPPNVTRIGQAWRYLGFTWAGGKPQPGLPVLNRLWLTLSIVRKLVVIPIWGLAWQLDELLYGRALDAVEVKNPLIKISAARSGSTQMARYLEEDPHLVAPPLVKCLFPYLWLWRLAPRTIGRVLTPERVTAMMDKRLWPEFIERHEGDIFSTDTFEGAFYIAHLNGLSVFLGPESFASEFSMGAIPEHNRHLWSVLFVDFFDRIARKTLLDASPGPDGQPRRLFIKGHFLASAEALAERYPDGRFLTMVRDPARRLQSMVNFLRANPVDPVLGNSPWVWLAAGLAESETSYNETEMAFFCADGPGHRCAVGFDGYVRDLEGTMSRVYRTCLDLDPLPDYVPRTHPPRNRTNYSLNRSLAQVGIDAEAFSAGLADYSAWMATLD